MKEEEYFTTHFRLNEECRLYENKLYLGKIHLFNCSNEAKTIIEYALNQLKNNIYFSVNDLLKITSKEKELQYMSDMREGLLDILLYLTRCKVLLVKKSFFTVADNPEAQQIVQNAILTQAAYDILAPTSPVITYPNIPSPNNG